MGDGMDKCVDSQSDTNVEIVRFEQVPGLQPLQLRLGSVERWRVGRQTILLEPELPGAIATRSTSGAILTSVNMN